jgi:general secretion pathway protein H
MMRRREECGFTLLEMIVVLVVLGLVLGLVITRGPAHSQRLDVDAAAREVTGAMRLARSRAIAEDRIVTVVFGQGGFRLDQEAPVDWSNDVFAAGDRAIHFSPDGGSSGGRIVLRSGDRQIAIGVDWLTGHVLTR